MLNVNHQFENNIQIERSELNKNSTMNKSTTCDLVVKIENNFKISVTNNVTKNRLNLFLFNFRKFCTNY